MPRDSLVVLLTGASRGIGEATARLLAQQGMTVIAAARPSEDLKRLAAILKNIRDDCHVIPADVRNEAEVVALVHHAFQAMGRIDVLINNAGIARSRPLLETPLSEFQEILSTNLEGVFLVTRETLKIMARQGKGHVINVGSDACIRGIPRMAPYVASKHGLLGLSRSISAEFGCKGIRVTTLMPGPVNTTILGAKSTRAEILQPQDLALTILNVIQMPDRAEVQELLLEPFKPAP